MVVEIKVIGTTLREESAIEMIHNCVDVAERGPSQGNVFHFKFESSMDSKNQYYRAWKVLKAISDILEIKP